MSDVIISPEDESQQQKYWNLFVNRDDAYAVQQLNGTYSTVNTKLTHAILFGEQTIGLYQLNNENKVKWAVIDFDVNKKVAKDDPNFNFAQWDELLKQQVQEASKLLKEINVPHYIEFSGFRGYHIWIFFKEAVDAGPVKRWMHILFHSLPKVHEHLEWELFPKQEKLTADGYGNLVKVPLQVHLKSGKTTYFVDENFNKIDGLPEVELYELDPVTVKAITETTKNAPKSFNATDKTVKVETAYPVPDNIAKMLANCAQLEEIVNKAETTNHLENEERVILANLGRFFGDPGLKWIHSVLSNCRDYDSNTTDYHISKLSGNPVYCDTVEKCRKNSVCSACKNKNNTPLSFGYTHISKHYIESKKLIEKLPLVIEKMGLKSEEKGQSLKIYYNNHEYYINKQNGLWLKQFNIIDFVRFVKPDDWELFLHENFPQVEANKFGVELTNKSITEVFPFKGEVFTFNQYLSERDAEIERVLTDSENYNLIAFTGGGKTFSLIKKIQDKNLKAVFLTPYESTAKQLESTYNVNSVYGTVSVETVREYIRNSKLICSTYDGLRKILMTQLIPEDYILLIDEAHNLITHSGFRYRALQVIFSNMDNFKKVINMTGTPEGVLNNDFKNIKFIKQNQKSHINNYEIIETEDKTLTACIDHLQNNPPGNGKVVIFKNSIKGLHTLKDAMIERGIKTEKIKVLNSNEKESKLFESITTAETIPANVKYVLTTSVISDGVNIVNQNIEAVYLLDVDNLLLLRQFVARFRRGVRNVYDMIPKQKYPATKQWFDFPVELKRIKALYEQIAKEKTKFLSECGIIKTAAETSMLKNPIGEANKEIDFLSINPTTEEVIVNYPTLTLDLLETFYTTSFADSTKRKEYLDEFLGVNCNISSLGKSKVDLTTSQERIKDEAEKKRKNLLDLLQKNPQAMITTYLQKVNPSLFHQIKNGLGAIYDPTSTSQQFFDRNKKLIKLKESQKLLQQYLELNKFQFPHDFIMEILDKTDNEIGEFMLDYYTMLTMHMAENHSAILKYSKKTIQVFNYAVFKFLYDFFKSNKEFEYDRLHKELNTYLLTEKITGKKIERVKLQEIVNRLIVKTRAEKRDGAKVKNIGWKFERFREIGDLVPDNRIQVINDSFKNYLLKKAEFMRAGLFIESLHTGSSSGAAVWKDVNEFRKMVKELGS